MTLSVTKVSRCEWGSGVLHLVLSFSLSHTGDWNFNMATSRGKELFEDLEKIIIALHKDGVGYMKISRPWNWAAARWPRPYSILTGRFPLRTGLGHGRPKRFSALLSVISRGCVWEIDVWCCQHCCRGWEGWGVSLSLFRHTAHTLQSNLSAWQSSRRKPPLKMIHKKARKQLLKTAD